MNTNTSPDIQEEVKKAAMFFKTLLASLFVIMVLAVFFTVLNGALVEVDDSTQALLKSVLIVIVLTDIPIGYWIFNQKINAIAEGAELIDKIVVYRKSHLIKLALLQGGALVSLVILLLTADFSLLLVFLIMLIVLLLNRPTIGKIITELKLTEQEQEYLESYN